MVLPCCYLGKRTFWKEIVAPFWNEALIIINITYIFRSAKHPEATNISSPSIVISPINQVQAKPDGEAEGEDPDEGEGRKICVDGDDIEFSGPLLVTYLK